MPDDGLMLHVFRYWVAGTPRRLVQAGLASFFGGVVALLFGALARIGDGASVAPLLAERFPDWPTWWVPESPAGYTAAVMLVAWGVWSLGTGLRVARARSVR